MEVLRSCLIMFGQKISNLQGDFYTILVTWNKIQKNFKKYFKTESKNYEDCESSFQELRKNFDEVSIEF